MGLKKIPPLEVTFCAICGSILGQPFCCTTQVNYMAALGEDEFAWLSMDSAGQQGNREDFTLPHLSYRNPPDSAGFHWSPPDSTPGLCQCDKGQIDMFSPGGVCQNTPESGIIQRSLRIPTRLFPVESAGQVHQTPPDSSGFHNTCLFNY